MQPPAPHLASPTLRRSTDAPVTTTPQFDVPATYPATAPEIELPELEGKTAKMYRGGKICLTVRGCCLRWLDRASRACKPARLSGGVLRECAAMPQPAARAECREW